MNTHPVQFPEEQKLTSLISSCLAGTDENRAQFLELRTDSGTFYVCPSRWQRLRLLWTFRHFHVLPQQVLTRRDQHLIEKLSRSSVVIPAKPVPRNAILGVVEKLRTKPMGTPQVVTMGKGRKLPARVSPLVPGLPTPGHHQRLFFDGRDPKGAQPAARNRGLPFRQWGAVGWLTAACLLVVVAKLLVASAPARTGQIKNPLPASVTQNAARSLPPARPLPAIGKAKQRPVALPLTATATVARHAPPLTSPPVRFITQDPSANELTKLVSFSPSVRNQRAFVSELPQGHFAAPIVADPNQVGELHLKAVIAADGSVQDVTLVSGDPKLAKAGIRAVRRWHYNPYEASATQVERETLINMKFFGQDAVSVTSVAR